MSSEHYIPNVNLVNQSRRHLPGPIRIMTLPADHPLRFELANEVHARPPEELRAPLKLTYLALLSGSSG
jgi:hypothetical protein